MEKEKAGLKPNNRNGQNHNLIKKTREENTKKFFLFLFRNFNV